MSAPTVPGLFRQRVQNTPEANAYYSLDEQGVWQPVSWAEAGSYVLGLTQGVVDQGLRPGDHVGIMASTSVSWELVQMAVFMAGGAVVGIDPQDLDENVQTIAQRSAINGLVVESSELLQKLDQQTWDRLKFVVAMENRGHGAQSCPTLESIQPRQIQGLLEDWDCSAADASATVIFTSGTTGTPKGIRYTHEQVVLACNSIVQALPDLQAGSRLVCWLPLSNLFQRMVNHCAVVLNASTYFVNDPKRITSLLPEIRPDVFIAVPRFFEKLYDGLLQEIRHKPFLVRRLFSLALRVGDRHARAVRGESSESLGNKLLYNLLDPLILKRFRYELGGELKFMISGSAPMPLWLLERFHALGLLILEAYGISENIVPIAMNRAHAYKFGSAGKPMPSNEITLSRDDEVLVRGLGVCTKYYTDEEEQELVDEAGYLHTGDLATFDEQGFLTLIGRDSEMIKTSTGRRIAPASMESRLRGLEFVEQAMIVGDNRKYLLAILAVTRSDSQVSSDSKAMNSEQPDELIMAIKQQVLREIQGWPSHQKPAGLIVTEKPFTVEAGELTSNLKLRRRKIQDKYSASIEALYQSLHEAEAPGSGAEQNDIMVIKT